MKKRLDQILVDRNLVESKTKAQALIMAGQVFVDEHISDKSGRPTKEDALIFVKDSFPYVSRGALKLEKAYQKFDLDFTDKTVCDIGSSTGGFTDFALQHGAAKVFAVDVGTGQLAQKIREDERVVVMERTDFREVTTGLKASSFEARGTRPEAIISDPIDIFVCDVSFISLKKIIPKIAEIIRFSPVIPSVAEESLSNTPKGSLQQGRDDTCVDIILLVKPQFEAGVKDVTKGKGVIKDESLRKEIVTDIQDFCIKQGLQIEGLVESPITGAKGNVEYLLYLQGPAL